MQKTTNINHHLGYYFPHTCPVCEQKFVGRKNQLYCKPEHKMQANNDKAAVRHARVAEQILILKRNAQILFDFIAGRPTPLEDHEKKLIDLGFISNGPSIPIRTLDNTGWIQVGCYVFNISKKTGTIRIMTIDQFKEL